MSFVKISGVNTILTSTLVLRSLGMFSTSSDVVTYFGVYKGDIPSGVHINTQTSIDNFRSSDLIFSTVLPTTSTSTLSLGVSTSTYSTATISGTATWVMVAGKYLSSSTNLLGAVIFDVSTGTQTQMQLNTDKVLKWYTYRVPGLNMVFPYSFTY